MNSNKYNDNNVAGALKRAKNYFFYRRTHLVPNYHFSVLFYSLEDEVEEKNHEANPQANPSNNDLSAQDRVENAQMERGTNDNVETNDEQAKDEESAPYVSEL